MIRPFANPTFVRCERGVRLISAPVDAYCDGRLIVPDYQRDELVDGQQRLLAMVAWLAGVIPAIHYATGDPIWCHSSADASALRHITIPYLTLPVGSSRREAMEVYFALNSGGTPHTAEELESVRRRLREEK